jgi:hypothetical protein
VSTGTHRGELNSRSSITRHQLGAQLNEFKHYAAASRQPNNVSSARVEEAKRVSRENAIRARVVEVRQNRERREQWERMQVQRQAEAARAAGASEQDWREAAAQIEREEAERAGRRA